MNDTLFEIMKKHISQRTIFVAGMTMLIAGLILGYAPLKRFIGERQQVASATTIVEPPRSETVSKETLEIAGKPIHLNIAAIGFDGDIVDGTYNANDGSWTLSKDKAHFALPSTLANNKAGNTFIYGHNNRHVFAALYKLKIGDRATVTTDNGHTFIYEYYSLTVTDPQDTSLFTYNGAPVLTLQTCSGVWYENRSLYAFKLMEVQ